MRDHFLPWRKGKKVPGEKKMGKRGGSAPGKKRRRPLFGREEKNKRKHEKKTPEQKHPKDVRERATGHDELLFTVRKTPVFRETGMKKRKG